MVNSAGTLHDSRKFRTLDDIGDIAGKRVLVRVDLNVPMVEGRISDYARITALCATVRELREKRAIVLLLSHFGRPKAAKSPQFSLSLLTSALSETLGCDVMFISEAVGASAQAGIEKLVEGDVAVLENTRFYAGEESNDSQFSDSLAALGDVYVNDAFSAAHRAHASTEGLARRLPAFAGRAMEAELRALESALDSPTPPVAAVVGGAKISTKIDVLRHLVSKVDHLLIGGGMANSFLAARGVAIGKSLYEPSALDSAQAIFAAAEAADCVIHLPYDVVVAKEFAANPPSLRTCNIHDIADDEMILDLALAAVEQYGDALKNCRTLLWNGPLGAFETPPFEQATIALARHVAALTSEGGLISVAGGGDTLAALRQAQVLEDFSFVSTAGGAFLEWMEGRALPGIEALRAASAR